jgi:hypothetical protein
MGSAECRRVRNATAGSGSEGLPALDTGDGGLEQLREEAGEDEGCLDTALTGGDADAVRQSGRGQVCAAGGAGGAVGWTPAVDVGHIEQ